MAMNTSLRQLSTLVNVHYIYKQHPSCTYLINNALNKQIHKQTHNLFVYGTCYIVHNTIFSVVQS